LIRSVLWALALLLAPALALIGAAPVPDGPRCAVERSAAPDPLAPGLYTVTLTTTRCAPDGVARVRLQSGRLYPWRTVPAGRSTRYFGVPWYWVGAWEAESGRVYTFRVPGMKPPWAR
jgi:hypothetical protein